MPSTAYQSQGHHTIWFDYDSGAYDYDASWFYLSGTLLTYSVAVVRFTFHQLCRKKCFQTLSLIQSMLVKCQQCFFVSLVFLISLNEHLFGCIFNLRRENQACQGVKEKKIYFFIVFYFKASKDKMKKGGLSLFLKIFIAFSMDNITNYITNTSHI